MRYDLSVSCPLHPQQKWKTTKPTVAPQNARLPFKAQATSVPWLRQNHLEPAAGHSPLPLEASWIEHWIKLEGSRDRIQKHQTVGKGHVGSLKRSRSLRKPFYIFFAWFKPNKRNNQLGLSCVACPMFVKHPDRGSSAMGQADFLWS